MVGLVRSGAVSAAAAAAAVAVAAVRFASQAVCRVRCPSAGCQVDVEFILEVADAETRLPVPIILRSPTS